MAPAWSELIEKAKNEEQDAFEMLYQNSYSAVYQTVKSMVKDDDTAMDIVQDAFVKGFSSLSSLEKPEQFVAWMKQIATNKAKDWFKKRQDVSFSQLADEEGEEPDFEDECPENLPDAVIDRKETARLIEEILGTLSEEQRIAIGMYYYQDMSVSEIAQELEVSENTVKSRLNYGRKKIRTSVEALAKQGVKLYSLAPVSFLVWLFRMQMAQTAAGSAPAAAFGNIMAGVAAQGTAAAVSSAGGAAAAAAAGTAASGSAAASGAVASGAAAVGKAGGLLASVGAKIAAGVVSVALIGGGAGAGIYLATRGNDSEPPAVSDTAAEQLSVTPAPAPTQTPTEEPTQTPATETPHIHKYNWVITTTGTCQDSRIDAFGCDCGIWTMMPFSVDPYNHSYRTEVVKPTETEMGYTLHECSFCHYSFKDDYTPATGPDASGHTHSYTKSRIRTVSCTTEGETMYTCSCGDSFTETVPPLGHSYTVETINSNENGMGEAIYICSTCGDSYSLSLPF